MVKNLKRGASLLAFIITLSGRPSRKWATARGDANAIMGKESDLDGIVGSDVVLIDGLEPAHVIVRVRHQMHVQLVFDDPG